jgi:hypothetical protein
MTNPEPLSDPKRPFAIEPFSLAALEPTAVRVRYNSDSTAIL